MQLTNAAACAHSNEGVEIGDIPDFDLYERRRLRLYPRGDPTVPLPEDFPARTSSEAVWSCQDTAMHDFIITLTQEDLEDVETILSHWKGV